MGREKTGLPFEPPPLGKRTSKNFGLQKERDVCPWVGGG